MQKCYRNHALISFATELLSAVELELDKSQIVARTLVEADLLGHDTHGLQLLSPYLSELESGAMSKRGEPRVIADFPAAITWDGMRLPGPWLISRAIDLAIERAGVNGTCAVVIRRSHHTACLAAYLQRVAERGFVIVLSCSAPAEAFVAPHGGMRSVYSPNPIAAAWPTDGDPVILDVSMSITSVGRSRRLQREGRKLPGQWMLNAEGNPTDDPSVQANDPNSTMLPIGGLDHGHKGYALALMVEALTSGLAGHGRADPSEGWSANVSVQVFDPASFGGREQLIRETAWLAKTCRATPPRPGVERVRLPGEAAQQKRRSQLSKGIQLYPGILSMLEPWAKKYSIPMPEPIDAANA